MLEILPVKSQVHLNKRPEKIPLNKNIYRTFISRNNKVFVKTKSH